MPTEETWAVPSKYLIHFSTSLKTLKKAAIKKAPTAKRAVFKMSYTLTFGDALSALKTGHKVCRKGWNGKKMWILLVSGTESVKTKRGSPYAKAGVAETAIGAHIDMMPAQGIMQPGWLASQADMLATDWSIIQ